MPQDAATDFSRHVGDELDRQRARIARDWVRELSSRLGIRPRRVLPTRDLLDHVPELIGKVAAHLRAGEDPIEAQEVVTSELARIARLRRDQGYDIAEVLREIELLGRLLDERIAQLVEQYPGRPEPREVATVAGWLHRSLQVMGTVVASVYREEELKERAATGRLLRRFADTLLHEIKTPLSAAESAARLLETKEMLWEPQEQARLAAIVARNLRRARAVIDDVRQLALAQSSYGGVGRVLPLPDVVAAVRAETAALAQAAGVEVLIAEPLPEMAVDAARVEMVLLNLVGNAIKYHDAAKQEHWVRIGSETRGPEEETWCRVEDNGPGIAAAHRERIFDRFFRAHRGDAEGTGLGLAIVREALDQMGSRIEVESEPGQGCVFRFLLPRPPDDQGEAD